MKTLNYTLLVFVPIIIIGINRFLGVPRSYCIVLIILWGIHATWTGMGSLADTVYPNHR